MYDKTAALGAIDQVVAQGPYEPSWESLSTWEPPKWYRNAKFGIFIHWGVYAVPAFGSEWYPRNMYIQGSKEYQHHIATYGPHKDFGYKDFIPLFKAEQFDPAAWAQLFHQAGARYVVPVAEHHDGFQMYKSELSHWNAAEMGPKRDVLGQLKEAVEAEGMVLGASSHRIEHWFFMSHGKDFDSDIPQKPDRDHLYWPSMPDSENWDDITGQPGPSQEFLEDWLVRTCELIDRYQPRILYFDWWIHHVNAKPYLKKLAAYYYNRAAQWGVEVAIDYKHDAYLFGAGVPDIERGQMADIKPYFWQTDTAIALNSWCYTENNDFRDPEGILCDLCDIVSKNGALLLNVGPKADGTFSEEDQAVLTAIGSWMRVNGEAIYDTRVWKTFGEGPTQVRDGHFSDSVKKNFTPEDFRFTTKGGALYAMALKAAEDGAYCVRSLRMQEHTAGTVFHGVVKGVEVLGASQPPRWTRDEEGLHLFTDYRAQGPVTFKIQLD
ncbi:alpha-L-fucosidase [Acutalibacter intestini]|uniref:alpha-L-fucosidase n=1 Tax=Acutalibacter intestini TaxID=3093659 RepID=UPI002AC8DD4D|nr:alpha-L-fucosidase [Acutalibacter sp. M00204]